MNILKRYILKIFDIIIINHNLKKNIKKLLCKNSEKNENRYIYIYLFFYKNFYNEITYLKKNSKLYSQFPIARLS